MLKGAKNLLYTLFKATCDPDPAFSGERPCSAVMTPQLHDCA